MTKIYPSNNNNSTASNYSSNSEPNNTKSKPNNNKIPITVIQVGKNKFEDYRSNLREFEKSFVGKLPYVPSNKNKANNLVKLYKRLKRMTKKSWSLGEKERILRQYGGPGIVTYLDSQNATNDSITNLFQLFPYLLFLPVNIKSMERDDNVKSKTKSLKKRKNKMVKKTKNFVWKHIKSKTPNGTNRIQKSMFHVIRNKFKLNNQKNMLPNVMVL